MQFDMLGDLTALMHWKKKFSSGHSLNIEL